MTSVESRVATMKFDNGQFMTAAKATMDVLAKLGGAISGLAAAKGLGSLSSSASKVDLTPVGTQIDGISNKFLALGTIAVTTLANITNRAVDAGLSLANSLTIAPITTGLTEYETNMKSIQTILANTSAAGTNLKDVTGALDELNEYADQTIYNFSEMAKNIGTFTAAGVDLETATGSIKGIANLAALSGSTSQQASSAMYQLSQEIASGRVTLMGWNSVVNAGMGGSVFQRALAETAVAMGTINEEAVSLQGEMKNVVINGQSFRDSISANNGGPQWLTSEVLTNTLKQFSGDLNRAELAAQGFNDAQIDGIMQQAKMATDAATKVKTLTQLIDVAKETAQSGWAETWRYIFGNFNEAKRDFTAASEAINGVINTMADARNEMFKEWKQEGGRDSLVQSITNLWKALGNVIKPIRNAFRDVFPPLTGKTLANITKAFEGFTESLIAGGPTMRNIREIFTVFFNVLKFGIDIVFGIVKYIASFFGLLFQGTGGVLDLAGAVAEVINGLIGWINEGELVNKFFDGLIEARAKVLGPIIQALSQVLSFLADIVRTGADAFFSAMSKAIELITPYLEDIGTYLEQASDIIKSEFLSALERVEPLVATIRDFFVDLFDSIKSGSAGIKDIFSFDSGGAGGTFEKIKSTISDLLPTLDEVKAAFSNFGDLLATVGKVIGAVLLAPFYLLGEGLSKGAESAGGFQAALGNVGEAIKSFIGTAGNFVGDILDQLNFQKIVEFLNTVLVAGIFLTFIRLQNNLGRLSGAFAGFADDLREVIGPKGILGQVQSNLQSMQNNIRADSIMKIAIALGILAGALFILAQLSPAEIGKGLGAIAGIMASFAVLLKVIGGGGGGEDAKPKEIAQNVASLVAFAGAMVAMAAAITILSAAVAIFGNMDTDTLLKGVGTIGAIMALFAGLAVVLGKGGAIGAVGLVAVAVAMTIMAGALLALIVPIKKYDKIDWGTLLDGLAKLALVIVVLGIAMTALSGGIGGAIGLFILAGALAVLVPQLVNLAEVGWSTILKGVAILAVSLGILGLVAAVVSGPLLILGAAIALIGIGFMAFGLGVAVFAAGLATLAVLGGTAAALLAAYIQVIAAQIPAIAELIGTAIAAISEQIIEHAPIVGEAFVALVKQMAKALIQARPFLEKTMIELIDMFIQVVRASYENLFDAGLDLVLYIMRGLEAAAPKLGVQAFRTFNAFADSFETFIPRIARRGLQMILEILRGIREGVDAYLPQITQEAIGIGSAVVEGVASGIYQFASSKLGAAIDHLVGLIPGPVKKLLGIASPSKVMAEIGGFVAEGLANGIADGAVGVGRSSEGVGRVALQTLQTTIGRMNEALTMSPDFNPVITPVLDLTQMAKDASAIGSMVDMSAMQASVSYSTASGLSQDYEEQRAANSEAAEPTPTTLIQFEQNNHSPKALSAAEIYLQTRNQISLAKEALSNS